MSDWWAKKLGGAAAPRTYNPPPQQHGYGQPPAREAWAQPQAPSQQPVFDPKNPIEGMAQWRGGDAHKKETQPCPNCGSGHFMSQQNTNPLGGGGGGAGPRLMTPNGMVTTAPRCFDCGYTTAHGLQTGSM